MYKSTRLSVGPTQMLWLLSINFVRVNETKPIVLRVPLGDVFSPSISRGRTGLGIVVCDAIYRTLNVPKELGVTSKGPRNRKVRPVRNRNARRDCRRKSPVRIRRPIPETLRRDTPIPSSARTQ